MTALHRVFPLFLVTLFCAWTCQCQASEFSKDGINSSIRFLYEWGRAQQAKGIPITVKGKPLTMDNLKAELANASPYEGYNPQYGIWFGSIADVMTKNLKWPVKVASVGPLSYDDARTATKKGWTVLYQLNTRWEFRKVLGPAKREGVYFSEAFVARFEGYIDPFQMRQMKAVLQQPNRAGQRPISSSGGGKIDSLNYQVSFTAIGGETGFKPLTLAGFEVPARTTFTDILGTYSSNLTNPAFAIVLKLDEDVARKFVPTPSPTPESDGEQN